MKPIVSPDGRTIEPRVWAADEPRAVVQILHGLAEHVDRYERFAAACSGAGLTVVGHNHRGHGPQPEDGILGHFADRDGWTRVVDDGYAVFRALERELEGLPVILLGHSMGSYIAQSLVIRKAPPIAALILSGSTWPRKPDALVGYWLASLLVGLRGRRKPSAFFDNLLFKNYNKRFAPNRTAFDWLSRDEAEVDRYVADPLCGEQSTHALWKDVFTGLREIGSRDLLRRIRIDLPILITGGALDPVGGTKALHRLAGEYESTDHPDVTLKLYDEGRHEMLNETNRDEVTRDWLGWIDGALGTFSTTD